MKHLWIVSALLLGTVIAPGPADAQPRDRRENRRDRREDRRDVREDRRDRREDRRDRRH